MKAKEWVEKFTAATEERFALVLKEFGTETAELVTARTKTSKLDSRLSAAEGAVREQKSKFRAVCGHVPALTETLFDIMLADAVPEYITWQKQSKTEKSQDDVKNYREQKGRHLPKKKGA